MTEIHREHIVCLERQQFQALVSVAFGTEGCGAHDHRSLLLHYQDLLCNHKKKNQDNAREDLKGPGPVVTCFHAAAKLRMRKPNVYPTL